MHRIGWPTYIRNRSSPRRESPAMFVMRIVGVLVVIVIGAGIVSYLFTGDKRYLSVAARVTRYALIFVLVVLVLMFLERVIVL